MKGHTDTGSASKQPHNTLLALGMAHSISFAERAQAECQLVANQETKHATYLKKPDGLCVSPLGFVSP